MSFEVNHVNANIAVVEELHDILKDVLPENTLPFWKRSAFSIWDEDDSDKNFARENLTPYHLLQGCCKFIDKVASQHRIK
jgi:hypothetical protein